MISALFIAQFFPKWFVHFWMTFCKNSIRISCQIIFVNKHWPQSCLCPFNKMVCLLATPLWAMAYNKHSNVKRTQERRRQWTMAWLWRHIRNNAQCCYITVQCWLLLVCPPKAEMHEIGDCSAQWWNLQKMHMPMS